MLLRIDTRAGEPIYVQIGRAVRAAIADGTLAEGDRLPAARDLARSLEVNMHTVLRAYSDLREAGVIDVRRGRGAVVLRPAPNPQLTEAVHRLLEVGEAHGLSLEQLHHALDQGARP